MWKYYKELCRQAAKDFRSLVSTTRFWGSIGLAVIAIVAAQLIPAPKAFLAAHSPPSWVYVLAVVLAFLWLAARVNYRNVSALRAELSKWNAVPSEQYNLFCVAIEELRECLRLDDEATASTPVAKVYPVARARYFAFWETLEAELFPVLNPHVQHYLRDNYRLKPADLGPSPQNPGQTLITMHHSYVDLREWLDEHATSIAPRFPPLTNVRVKQRNDLA